MYQTEACHKTELLVANHFPMRPPRHRSHLIFDKAELGTVPYSKSDSV